ncbi:MAG: ATP-binding protein [Cyanobacteria bacterium P01_F01_bin.150]
MAPSNDLLHDSEALLKKIYSAFHPFNPPPEGAYVDCEGVRGNWNIIREMGRKITRSDQPICQLYSGYRGVGKSTELIQLREYLTKNHYKVVYFAADEADIEPQDTQYADILFACTRHLVEAVKLDSAHNPLVQWMQQRWASMKDLALMDMEFEKLNLEQQIGLFPKISATFKAVPDKRREMRRKINNETPSLVQALNAFIHEAEKSLSDDYSQGLVVIVDNLDRIAEIREGEGKPSNYDEIYINRSEMLRGLACHVIYTAPISMVYSELAPQLDDRYAELSVLPMVTVRWADGTVNPEGLSKLKELIIRRIQTVDTRLAQTLEGPVAGLDIPAVFDSPESLERLCLMSGGHARNLMQLIQKAIDWTDTLPISQNAVNRSIADARSTFIKGIQEKQWPLLAQAYRHQQYKRNSDYLRLLLNRCILEYHHYYEDTGLDDTWCNIHPLIEAIPQFQAALNAIPEPTPSGQNEPELSAPNSLDDAEKA